MTKKRVHEIAKELNIESKEVISRLADVGIEIKSALSMVSASDYKKIMHNNNRNNKDTKDERSNKVARNTKRPSPKGNRDSKPAVVDRVPSRPPDHRFEERKAKSTPSNRGKAPTGGGRGKPSRPQGGQGKQGGGQKSHGRPSGNQTRPTGKPTGRPPSRPTKTQTSRPRREKEIQIPKPDPVVAAQAKAKAQERPRSEQRKNNKPAAKDMRIESRERKEKYNKRHRRKRRPKGKRSEVVLPGQPLEKKPITIGESLTVQQLAEKLRRTAADIIKTLMTMGVMATINQEIDSDTATIIAGEYGYEVIIKLKEDIEETVMTQPEDDEKDLKQRPPVVTVMGHVDHGKTSLLDAIREAKVTSTEAGGITQHIGAYQITKDDKKITFLDTPGHAAFTAMRARGAKATDIAILVVAADDGVMPQTIEAINHAKAAEVPIIIAINKIDKPDANPDRVRQELTNHGLVVEQWGGDIISVEVSALQGTGIDELLEMVLLVSEMGELKANPQRLARGIVVEAELDKGRGPVATVLVQTGTLNIGDSVVVGSAHGRVRAMMDHQGGRAESVGPSTPVEVLGLNNVPEAGDVLVAVDDEKTAKAVAEKRVNKKREEEHKLTTKLSLEDLFKNIKEGNIKDLPIVVKTDVHGTVEALRQSLENLSNEEVKVTLVHGGVGAITETDIMLASASNAIVIGFNVRPDVNARKAAEAEKIDIRLYRVIYDAIDDVKAAMSGLLDPELREVIIGRVEVRKTFKASKIGTIAGCYVTEGKITRDAGVRVIRDGIVIHEGKLDTLKRFKDDAREVMQGYECGLTVERYNDLKEEDTIEVFITEEIKRQLT